MFCEANKQGFAWFSEKMCSNVHEQAGMTGVIHRCDPSRAPGTEKGESKSCLSHGEDVVRQYNQDKEDDENDKFEKFHGVVDSNRHSKNYLS